MNCGHPTKALVGTARGIECRACGAVFSTFSKIHAVAENPPATAPEKPKKGRKKADD